MSISLDGSLGTIGHHTKVKIKGVVFYYIGPLYGIIPKIIFDKKTKFFHKNFSENCISNDELLPNNLKIGKELHEEEEVEVLFGLVAVMVINIVTTMMRH
jgi:hypothetical protein